MLFRFRTTLGVGKESDRVIDDSDETEQVGEAERIGRLGARRRNYGTEGQAEPEDCSTKVCKKNGFVHMGGWQTRRNSARQLILILESTCRTSSSSNAGVERGRWIFTASISLLALTERRMSITKYEIMHTATYLQGDGFSPGATSVLGRMHWIFR